MVDQGKEILSIGSESQHSVFTKIDIKGLTTKEKLWNDKNCSEFFNLKRGILLIFGKKTFS